MNVGDIAQLEENEQVGLEPVPAYPDDHGKETRLVSVPQLEPNGYDQPITTLEEKEREVKLVKSLKVSSMPSRPRNQSKPMSIGDMGTMPRVMFNTNIELLHLAALEAWNSKTQFAEELELVIEDNTKEKVVVPERREFYRGEGIDYNESHDTVNTVTSDLPPLEDYVLNYREAAVNINAVTPVIMNIKDSGYK
jgi:hypothetical protein